MVRRSPWIHPLSQLILSLGASVFMGCSGLSLFRATSYQLELAQYKLEVSTAFTEVRKASGTLKQSVESSPIAPREKRKILNDTRKSDRILDAAEKDIEEKTEKLIKKEIEE